MKAHACLQEAHALAPNEDYIIKHLQIIETRLTRLKSQSAMSREKELAFSDFDPSEFGGRASSKSSSSASVTSNSNNNIKISQFHTSSSTSTSSPSSPSSIKSNTVAEKLRQSNEPQFHETTFHDDDDDDGDYHGKQESLKQRIQNNFATDLDDPSSGMS